jgi:C4-dicarboxylate transporter DctQ subunit
MAAKASNWIERIEHYLEVFISTVSVVACSTLAVLLFTSVIFRFVLKIPLSGINEISSYAMIWFVFVGGALALRKGAHVGVDIFKAMLPARAVLILELLTYLFIFTLMILLIKEGFAFVLNRTWEVTPSLMLPTWTTYIAIPIGAVLMAVQLVLLIIKTSGVLIKTFGGGRGGLTDSGKGL